jgi:hypothetical protein
MFNIILMEIINENLMENIDNKDYQYFLNMIKYMNHNELNDLKEILQIQVNTRRNYYTNQYFTQIEINNMNDDIKYIDKFIKEKIDILNN